MTRDPPWRDNPELVISEAPLAKSRRINRGANIQLFIVI